MGSFCNGNGEQQNKTIGLDVQKTTLHAHQAFLYIIS